jgi:formylglycine-generating enzyme required for sulfatase activity
MPQLIMRQAWLVSTLGLFVTACSIGRESSTGAERPSALPYLRAFVFQEIVEHDGRKFTAAAIADRERNGLAAIGDPDRRIAELVRAVLQEDFQRHRSAYLVRIHLAQGEAFEGGAAIAGGRFDRESAQRVLWRRIVDDPWWQQRVFPAVELAALKAGVAVSLPVPASGNPRVVALDEVARVHAALAGHLAEDAESCAGNPLVAFQRIGGADPDVASAIYQMVVDKPEVALRDCVESLKASGWKVVAAEAEAGDNVAGVGSEPEVPQSDADLRLLGAWIHLREPWVDAPAELELNQSTAGASVARFCADGSFTLVVGNLYRYGETISVGADLGLTYRGRWHTSATRVSVDAALDFQLVAGHSLKRRLQFESTIGDEILIDGIPHERAPALDEDLRSACGRPPRDESGPELWEEPATGMLFVELPPGRFVMGSPETEPDREDQERQHEVVLTSSFWLGVFEVTQREWALVMESNPSHFRDADGALPIENVTWFDVQEFLARLTSQSPGSRFRLPTEAEWEYACRAGTTTAYSVGAVLGRDDANTASPPGSTENDRTKAVGSYSANAWGLWDMHGNVWEWTSDEYCPYDGAAADPALRCGSSLEVIRGGSWHFGADSARCALRYKHSPGDKGFSLGFRVVREAEGQHE